MDLVRVERELASFRKRTADGQDAVVRACTLNLIVACTDPEDALEATAVVARLSELHPARVLLVTPGYGRDVDAQVSTHCHLGPGGRQVCCEQVTIEVQPGRHDLVPQTLLQLLVEDLPVFTWWRHTLIGDDPLLQPLAAMSDRFIVYSSSAPDPRKALERILDAVNVRDDFRSTRDLTWVRLDGWREMVASFFDVPQAAEDLARVDTVSIVGGGGTTPAGITASGAYIAGWLASRLGWTPSGTAQRWIRADGGPIRFDFNVDPELVHGRIAHVRIEAPRPGGGRAVYLAQRLGPDRKSVRLTVSGGAISPVPRVEKLDVVEPHVLLAGEMERDSDDPFFVAALRNAATIVAER